MRQVRSALSLLGLVACALPAAATAQAKLELTPFFASHYSLSNYYDEQIDLGSGPETVQERTGRGPAVGARLAYWLKPTLAIEIEGVYSEANNKNLVPDRDAAAGEITGAEFDASATLLSARAVYRPRRSNLRLFGGISRVAFSGGVYDYEPYGYTNLNTIGGVVGLGVRAQATRTLALDIAVEAYLHNLDRDGSDGDVYDGTFQQELLVTVGVPIKLGS